MKSKALAMLLSLCMVVSLLPTVALATEGEGTSTVEETQAEDTAEEPVTESEQGTDAEAEDTVTEPEEETEEQNEEQTENELTEEELTEEEQNEEQAEEAEQEQTEDEQTEEEQAEAVEPQQFEDEIMPLDEVTEADADEEEGTEGNPWDVSADADGSVKAYLEKNGEADTYTLTISGEGAMKDFQNPTGTNFTVFAPWYEALKDSKDDSGTIPITEIVIGDEITGIGDYAFARTKIKTAEFKQNVTDYGNSVYSRCTELTAVDWTNFNPENITDSTEYKGDHSEGEKTGAYVPLGLFDNCANLNTCIIDGKTYEEGVLVLPSNIKGICSLAFRNTGFTTIDFSNDMSGVEQVGFRAFSNMKKLQSVSIHGGIAFYGIANAEAGTFGYSSVSDVVLKEGVETIPHSMFADCTSLKSIAFPASLEKIGVNAFKGTALESVELGAVTEIGANAFTNCTSLKTVKIEGSAELSLDSLFLTQAPLAFFELGNGKITFAPCANKYTLITVILGEGVAEVVGSSFTNIGKGSIIYAYNSTVAGLMTVGTQYTGGQTSVAITDGGTFAADTEFQSGTLVTPEKDGYTFDGWYLDGNFSGDALTGTPTTGKTYTAKWTLDAPTVEVTADKSVIAAGQTATLTATVGHGLAGVTYEYQWYTGTTDSGTKIDGATESTYTVSGNNLTSPTDYYCKVTVTDKGNTSEATSEGVTITKADAAGSVTITDAKTTATYGDAPFTFTYTVSGNDTANVTTSDSSVATVTADNGIATVTIVGAGETEILVDFAGNADYSSASASFKLNVSKATLTITVADATIRVGNALPEFTYTVSGLIGDDKLTTEPTLTCAADGKTVGTFAITADGAEASDNYTIDYVSGALTVRRRSSSSGGGSSTSNSITTNGGSHGSVSLSDRNASEGTTVTITVTPDSGYELDELTVTDRNGRELRLTDKGNGRYTFTMPDGRVTVETSFVKISEKAEEPTDETTDETRPETAENPFVDVTSGDWFYNAALYAYENEWMSGTTEDTFSPNVNTTRGMIVTILYRMEGEPAVSGVAPFIDVTSDQYYAKAVAWAAAHNIVAGYDAQTFAPNDSITREQLASILYRYAAFKGYDTAEREALSEFADAASVSAWASDSMQWAVGESLLSGKGNGVLAPTATATRAELAQILMNFDRSVK